MKRSQRTRPLRFVLLCLLAALAASFDVRPLQAPAPAASEAPVVLEANAATPSPLPQGTPYVPGFSDYAPTTRMDFSELVGDNGDYEAPLGYPAAETYRVIVDVYHQVVLIYGRDADGAYTVPVRYMLCSTGLNNRTPLGTFFVKRYRVRFGLFQNDGTYGQYWTLIRGRIYFHSTLYSARDADTYLEETYLSLGRPASHGCIRLTVPDARFLYYNLAYGAEIEIRAGDPADEETAAIKRQIILPAPPESHITLLPGEIPDTDNWRIEEVPHVLPYEAGSQKGQE